MPSTTKTKPKPVERLPNPKILTLERGLPIPRVRALRRLGGLVPLPEPELLSMTETMWKLNICKATLKWYVKQGILHPVRLSARHLRYKRAELEQLLAEAE